MSTAASDHVKDGTDSEAASNNPANPDVKLGKCQWCAEDVEERLDPEWVDEGAVLKDVFLLDEDSQEEEAEETVVSLHNDSI